MTLSSIAAPQADAARARQAALFRFAPQADAVLTSTAGAGSGFENLRAGRSLAKEVTVDVHSLPAASQTNYLNAPNGETWFYTLENISEIVDHGSYQEEVISGFKINVYDADFQLKGSVEDEIELADGEVRVAQISVGAQLTQKFFNYDTNYELMVGVACNTEYYVVNYHTFVYSIAGSKTETEHIAQIPGYYVSAINTSTDSWSEKFWITFMTEEDSETPEVGGVMNVMDYEFRTYKAAGYGGLGDPVLTTRVPGICIGGEHAVPFIASQHGGIPYFAVNGLKYSWFEDPNDFTNENPTQGNELVVDIYAPASSWASTVEKYSTTTIPMSDVSLDNRYFLYLGGFSYEDDLSFDRYDTDGAPALIITKEHHISASDSYNYDYDVYKAAAKGETVAASHLLNFATGVDGGYFMNDIPGYDPQVMFAKVDGASYRLDFVSLISGEVEHSIKASQSGMSLTSSTERVAFGDSYLYVAAQNHGESQANGDVYTFVAYFNTDGTLHHVDKLNMGKDVDMAQVYIAPDAFNPYIFNLDDKREYMVLLKRKNEDDKTRNHEELMVLSEDPADAPLFVVASSEENGVLSSMFYANLDTDNPRLVIITQKDGKFITSAYALPLELFTKGDGTVDNPYEIVTAGGLQQLKAHPAAHFALGCDIDAAGVEMSVSNFDFSGSLNGRGHHISNLTLSGSALVPALSRASTADELSPAGSICDIVFVDPVYNDIKEGSGLLVNEMRGGVVRNVHVYGGRYSGGSYGGIVGSAYLGSVIEESSVNAEMEGESIGGVVYNTRTGTTVRACAFSGSIKGTETIGGIVASFDNADDVVENCHVNAEIIGENTIGGIAGASGHGAIRFCHVEGSLTATKAPQWGGGPKTGGIVGNLSLLASSGETGEGSSTNGTVAVEGCYVNLSSMTYTGQPSQSEDYPGQNSTMHRIVGGSVANMEPEIIGYDSEWNPIYSDEKQVEKGLKDNYAVSTLAIVEEGIADDTATTEGKSVAAGETGMEFFSGLGFCYGYDSENPWSFTGDQTKPALYFEGGLLLINPAEATIDLNAEIDLDITCKGGEITEAALEGFSMEISDESVLEVLDMGMRGEGKIEGIYLTVKGVKGGTAVVTVNLNGKSVKSTITVKAQDGISDAVAESSSISFDGRTVLAEGCSIDVFTTMGVKVLGGNDSLDLGRLGQGIYIVSATAADGSASTLKVNVR
mgnify:CR=1 FL=1